MGAEGADGKASNGDDGVVNIIPINPSVINGDLSFQDSGDEMGEVFESLPVEEVEELGEENEKVNGEGEEDNGLSDEVVEKVLEKEKEKVNGEVVEKALEKENGKVNIRNW